jgi:hypothetical protein
MDVAGNSRAVCRGQSSGSLYSHILVLEALPFDLSLIILYSRNATAAGEGSATVDSNHMAKPSVVPQKRPI